MTSHLDFLNRQQRAFVAMDVPSLLVIGGAGTGKTTLIAHKVLDLINKGVPPEKIGLLTVSHNAAKHLSSVLSRISSGLNIALPTPTTIASLCFRLLQQVYGKGFGSTDHFYVLPNEDDPRLIEMLQQAIAASPRYLPQEESLPAIPPSPSIANARAIYDTCFKLKSIAGRALNLALNDDEYDLESIAEQYGQSLMMMACIKAFEINRQHLGFMTLPDMLIKCAEIYRYHPKARKFLVRFDHVLIDEGADLNYPMLACVRSTLRKSGRLMIVGDPNQCVLGKMGADGVLLSGQIEHLFPGTKVVSMGINYRYGASLASRLHSLPMHIGGRFTSETEHLTQLIVRRLPLNERIAFIKSFIQSRNANTGSIAVLARTRGELFNLEVALVQSKIAYWALGILPLAYNHIVQTLAALFGAPAGHLDNMDAKQRRTLIMSATELFFPEWPFNNRRETIRMLDFLDAPDFSGLDYLVTTLKGAAHFSPNNYLYQRRINLLVTFLERGRDEMRDGNWLSRQPLTLAHELGLLDLIKKSTLDVDDHYDSIALYHMLTDGSQKHSQTVGDFLYFFHQAYRVNQRGSHYNLKNVKTPTISTFLRAKGSEFDNVFIWDASEGVVPSTRRSDLLDFSQQRQLEVNLFHVAVTRARHSLYLLHDDRGLGEFASLLKYGEPIPSRSHGAQPLPPSPPPLPEKGPGYQSFKAMVARIRAVNPPVG